MDETKRDAVFEYPYSRELIEGDEQSETRYFTESLREFTENRHVFYYTCNEFEKGEEFIGDEVIQKVDRKMKEVEYLARMIVAHQNHVFLLREQLKCVVELTYGLNGIFSKCFSVPPFFSFLNCRWEKRVEGSYEFEKVSSLKLIVTGDTLKAWIDKSRMMIKEYSERWVGDKLLERLKKDEDDATKEMNSFIHPYFKKRNIGWKNVAHVEKEMKDNFMKAGEYTMFQRGIDKEIEVEMNQLSSYNVPIWEARSAHIFNSMNGYIE